MDTDFDVIFVGGGPAALGGAIHGASDGLRIRVCESRVIGGKAGESHCIANYAARRDRPSGDDLTGDMAEQAREFGAELRCPLKVTGLTREADRLLVATSDGETVSTHTAVLASGLSYMRLDKPGFGQYLGHWIFYGKPALDPLHLPKNACVVGGANSAGQAAQYLAKIPGCTVRMLVRGPNLSKEMSAYLVREIAAMPNIEVCLNTEIIRAIGDGRLRAVGVKRGNEEMELPVDVLSINIGGEPKTEWLRGIVALDERGYILVGRSLPEPFADPRRSPFSCETSFPGVFAAGDVVSDSVKRIPNAVSGGTGAIQDIHSYIEWMAAHP